MPEELTEDRAAEIRDQERRKLQGVIDKLSREKEDLQNEIKSFESKSIKKQDTGETSERIASILDKLDATLTKDKSLDSAELKEIKETLSKMTAPKTSGDIQKLENQLAELSKTIKEERERNAEMAKDLTAKQQRLMISEAIRAYGKPVIEELVGGNTEDEIKASIEKAAARYEEIISSALPKDKPTVDSTEDDTPAKTETNKETQPVAGEERAPESSTDQKPLPYATGSGPQIQSSPSKAELIEKLQSLTGKERLKFMEENRDTLRRIAESQFAGSTG